MKKVLASPRKDVTPEAAHKVATMVAQNMGFEIKSHQFNQGSRQLVLMIPDLETATLRRFTMTLREEHKSTFTYVSGAQKA